jgi:SAM-dependent methyltransferase
MTDAVGRRALPAWTDHAGHRKIDAPFDPSRGEIEPYVQSVIDCERMHLGRPRQEIRVLDFGCGRGERVAWLCDQGWNAWGADIVERYLAQGRAYFNGVGLGANRTRLIEDSRRLPFEEKSFDIVLSDQVIEHVRDLDECVAGLQHVSRWGAAGLHVFPARWHPIEAHMRTPLAHWVPKGRARQAGIKLSLAVGLAVGHFRDLTLDERAEVFSRFSHDETFYRSEKALRTAFLRYGMSCDFRVPPAAKVRLRRPWIPESLVGPTAVLYRTFVAAYLMTRLDRLA